ncbi:MAG: TlpA family protein disulfide reductase [Gammaproteobacteria bacterium]|nr:TlpA family protein disulfide reductase [Gammaproteobacteria bacterium]
MLSRHAYRLLLALLMLCPLLVNAAQAPKFKLPTLKSTVDLSSYTGKVVYVDFWASWCDPCRKSFPWMSELQGKYKDNLKVIAINLDQERGQAIKFLNHHRPGFTVAFDPQGKIAEAYKVPGMPTSYLIDQSGRIVFRQIGFRNSEKQLIENRIQSLLSNRQARAK